MSRLVTTRRALLFGAGALGLFVAVEARRLTDKGPSVAGQNDADGAFLHDWIHVGDDGVVSLRCGQSEMGQGVFTGIATLVAEELGCRLDQMRVETGPASNRFKNIVGAREVLVPDYGFARRKVGGLLDAMIDFAAEAATGQVTGGSSSLADRFESARFVGAAARQMLIQAAARQWGAPETECVAKDGAVVHEATKRALGFGDLARAAAKETPPPSVALKPRDQWTLVGSETVRRVDIPAKVDGSAKFGIDTRRPGMAFAAIANCPVFGGRVKSVDDAAARKSPGVVAVVTLADAVAVVADSTWRAKRGVEALNVVWDEGPAAALDDATIAAQLVDALGKGRKAASVGDFAGAFASAPKTLRADYQLPYLAHAAMEPINCTAEVGPDFVEVWAPTQSQSDSVAAAASAAGMSAGQVRLHTPLLGGGFGRRLETDYVRQAVLVAKQVGKPVQILWSREEDMTHDFYRPAAIVRAEGGLNAAGQPVALHLTVASQSIMARVFPPATWTSPDFTQFEGTVALPYAIPNRLSEAAAVVSPVPIGSWRSVGHSITSFAKECFIDEMAHEAGVDPLQYRLALLVDEPRLAALLRLAAEKAGWGQKAPAGHGRGVALHASFGSAVVEIVDVAVGDKGGLKVERVVAAVDCGQTVNPDVVRAQTEGSIIYALSAALFGKITIKAGRVVEQNFPDYDVVHMAQAPKIEVYVTPSAEPPGGIGEPATPPLAPALANAIFAATGKRVRTLPLVSQGFSA